MAAIGLKLIAISLAINGRQLRHSSLAGRDLWITSYDYIVVGGGTSGCVVAARLADDLTKSVALLEAGGAQTTATDIPAFRQDLTGSPIDWSYAMVPQKYSFIGRRSNQMTYSAGRVFGGTSAISHSNYYRESEQYFNQWSASYDIKNWTFVDVLPYFLKSENNLDTNLTKNQIHHQTGGPLSVSTVTPDPILHQYLVAAEKLGFNTGDDDNQFGPRIMQRTVDKEVIALSSASAFIESKSRPNLVTLSDAFVTKILFDRNNKAIGVTFQKEGSLWTLKARKEIIVSAGVVGSAQLLLLSGIGPKDHLRQLNISLISDLEVGTILRHSLSLDIDFDIRNQSLVERPLKTTDNDYKYYIENSGPLVYTASAVQCFPQVIDDSTGLSSGCLLPHIYFLANKTDHLIEGKALKNEWDYYYRLYSGHLIFKLRAVLRRAKSIGSLRLESNNPFVRPLIDPQVFEDQTDVDQIVETLNQSLRIFTSESMSQWIDPFYIPVPGCVPCLYERFCGEYLRCMAYVATGHLSLVGTCRMGSKQGSKSVVDERFGVKGVTGLRVIDASVLPIPTDQNMAVAVMLAERGADFIDEDNKIGFKFPEFKLNLTQISDYLFHD